jgi:hypothetical protein
MSQCGAICALRRAPPRLDRSFLRSRGLSDASAAVAYGYAQHCGMKAYRVRRRMGVMVSMDDWRRLRDRVLERRRQHIVPVDNAVSRMAAWAGSCGWRRDIKRQQTSLAAGSSNNRQRRQALKYSSLLSLCHLSDIIHAVRLYFRMIWLKHRIFAQRKVRGSNTLSRISLCCGLEGRAYLIFCSVASRAFCSLDDM